MITFMDPRWLWGFIALPVLFLLEWRAARRAERGVKLLVGAREDHPLLVQRRAGQRRTSLVLRLAALAFLLLGAAGPEWGRELVRRAASGSDVVLMMDVSASMDARDVAPSRLEEARREALAVVERLQGSRVAVVAFAGDAVRVCPLTLDVAAARLVLESLSSGSVSQPGTDIGRALRLALKVVPGGRRDEQAIVLWTDGEDLEQGARAAIDDVVAAGTRVFAVGVGTRGGDVIPVLDDQGRATDVKRDDQGAAVRSRLDEDLLRTLARRTRGGFFSASRPGGELPRLLGALSGLGRSSRGERLVERPVARFPLCAALAALLLTLDLARPRRRVPATRARRRARAATAASAAAAAAASAALLFVTAFALPARAQSAWAKGDAEYRAGRYPAAESLYTLRAKRGAPGEVQVNRATAGALAGKREDAERDLAKWTAGTDRAGHTARYNLGTLKAGDQAWDEALAQLQAALEADPNDQDARWNYELALRKKQEQQEKKSPNSQKQKPQPQPQQPNPSQPGSGSPQPPTAGQPPRGAPQPSQQQGTPPPNGSQGMTRGQAEQLLGALEDMARAEQQRSRKVQVMRERRGKDW